MRDGSGKKHRSSFSVSETESGAEGLSATPSAKNGDSRTGRFSSKKCAIPQIQVSNDFVLDDDDTDAGGEPNRDGGAAAAAAVP